MRARTPERAKQERAYSKARLAYLEAIPVCQVCFAARSTQVHHKQGRRGVLLLDESKWLAVCLQCHDDIGDFPRWAMDHGYTLSRVSGDVA